MVVICQAGPRATRAADLLGAAGAEVTVLDGGMNACAMGNLLSKLRYNRVAGADVDAALVDIAR